MYQLSELEQSIIVIWNLLKVCGIIYLFYMFVRSIFTVRKIEQYLQTNIPYIEKMLEDLQKSLNG